VLGDGDRPPGGHGDLVRLLERAMAIAQRRRLYRLGLAVIGLAAFATLVVLGIELLVRG
jgi:hypothetical protein